MKDMFKNCSALVPWWYIDDNKKRKKAIEERKRTIDFKEQVLKKIEEKMEVNKKRLLKL